MAVVATTFYLIITACGWRLTAGIRLISPHGIDRVAGLYIGPHEIETPRPLLPRSLWLQFGSCCNYFLSDHHCSLTAAFGRPFYFRLLFFIFRVGPSSSRRPTTVLAGPYQLFQWMAQFGIKMSSKLSFILIFIRSRQDKRPVKFRFMWNFLLGVGKIFVIWWKMGWGLASYARKSCVMSHVFSSQEEHASARGAVNSWPLIYKRWFGRVERATMITRPNCNIYWLFIF